MSSTDLETPSNSTPLTLLDPSDSSLSFEPNLDFLSANTLLSLLGGFDPELQTEVEDFVGSLDQAEGEITVTNGVVTSDLSFADGTTLQGTLDTPTALLDLANLAANSNGSLSLNTGFLTGELTSGETTVSLENFDLATTAGSLVEDFLTSLEGTFAFADGIFTVDAPTPFGPITGSVGFATGALTLDLLTPAGAIAGAVDFGDDAVIPFDVPLGTGLVTGLVDFNQGLVSIPLFPGYEATVPLEALAGNVTVEDGIATLNLDTSFGTYPIAFEFGPLASEAVSDFVNDFSGSATVTNGVFEGSLETPLGPLSATVDLVALANQAADFAQQVSGSVSVAAGSATALLDTPLGLIDQVIDLTNVDSLLSTPLIDLF